MTQELWTDVDDYLAAALLAPDKALDEALKASEAAGLPEIQVSPTQGKLLLLLAQMLGARLVLEIGTLGAYSTIWLARGLAAGGRVFTIEYDRDYAAIARSNIARAGLADRIDLRIGRALDVLPRITAEGIGPFDIAFIDADKTNIPEYFEWALRLSRPGSLIIVDNVVRDGEVINGNSEEPDIKGIRRFLQMAGRERRVTGTALQTVGIKGHDGFAILRVVR
jgi:predicted O-methyltransferase YrrM